MSMTQNDECHMNDLKTEWWTWMTSRWKNHSNNTLAISRTDHNRFRLPNGRNVFSESAWQNLTFISGVRYCWTFCSPYPTFSTWKRRRNISGVLLEKFQLELRHLFSLLPRVSIFSAEFSYISPYHFHFSTTLPPKKCFHSHKLTLLYFLPQQFSLLFVLHV